MLLALRAPCPMGCTPENTIKQIERGEASVLQQAGRDQSGRTNAPSHGITQTLLSLQAEQPQKTTDEYMNIFGEDRTIH